MQFSLGCQLSYEVADSATLILKVEAMRTDQQRIASEGLEVTPAADAEAFVDPNGGNRFRRLNLSSGNHTIRYQAEVAIEPLHEDPAGISEIPVAQLPLSVLPFLNPSRYCLSDEMARFANRQFGGLEPGHGRITAICNWIYEHVDYMRQSSDPTTTAMDTFGLRAGVCRDFAHLGITFCRALGIPARFVSAYAWQLQPPDFHAVFEAYLSGRWYLFDATRQAALDGIVRIGNGRDAADTAFASIFGNVTPGPMRVWIEPSQQVADATRTVEAVSVSA